MSRIAFLTANQGIEAVELIDPPDPRRKVANLPGSTDAIPGVLG